MNGGCTCKAFMTPTGLTGLPFCHSCARQSKQTHNTDAKSAYFRHFNFSLGFSAVACLASLQTDSKNVQFVLLQDRSTTFFLGAKLLITTTMEVMVLHCLLVNWFGNRITQKWTNYGQILIKSSSKVHRHTSSS